MAGDSGRADDEDLLPFVAVGRADGGVEPAPHGAEAAGGPPPGTGRPAGDMDGPWPPGDQHVDGPVAARRRWLLPTAAAGRAVRPWAVKAVRSPVVQASLAFLAAKTAMLLFTWLLLGQPESFLHRVGTAWDTGHYLLVAREGYRGEPGLVTNEYHWPPLFILVVRAFGSGDMAPFWINQVAGLLAVAVTTRLMGRRAGLFFALFPTWLVYASLGYTEGLFVLLAALALLLWREGRPAIAGAAAGVAFLARYAAAFAFATFAMWLVVRQRWRALWFLAPLAAAGLGVMAWHTVATGDPLAYIEASRAWGKTLGWPWEQVDWILHGWFTNQDSFHQQPYVWLLRNLAFLIPSALGLVVLIRSDPPLAAFCAGTFVVVLFAAETQIVGIPRYLLAAFPAIAVLGTRVRGLSGWITYVAAALVASVWVLTEQLDSFFA